MVIGTTGFDEFQLMELLGLPCFARQAYVPPFRPSNCTSNEKSMIFEDWALYISELFLPYKPDCFPILIRRWGRLSRMEQMEIPIHMVETPLVDLTGLVINQWYVKL